MIIRSEKVPESPSSALQTMYFWSAVVPSTVFHLMPVGNAAPPRPRRPDCVTASTICGPLIVERAAQAPVAAVRLVIVERDRIGDADPGEGQPLLLA